MSDRDRRQVPPSTVPGSPDADPGTLDELVSDCRRIAPRWRAGKPAASKPVPPSSIHGTEVPEKSAHAVEGMSDYGS